MGTKDAVFKKSSSLAMKVGPEVSVTPHGHSASFDMWDSAMTMGRPGAQRCGKIFYLLNVDSKQDYNN